jgi:hypothetical protein
MTAGHRVLMVETTSMIELLSKIPGHASRYSTRNTVLVVVGTLILISVTVVIAAAIIKWQSRRGPENGTQDPLHE